MFPRSHGLSPSTMKYVSAAAVALDAGRVDEADRQLAMALAAQPDHPEVLRMQAGIHGLRGEYRQAIDAMQRALSMRQQDPVYLNTMGMLLGSAGNFDAAITALRRSCELQPDFAIAWYNLGVMLTKSVRSAEAVSALRQALTLLPQHVGARALLADTLRTEGLVEAAASEYRKILAEQPWAGMAWWGLADLKDTRFQEVDIDSMRAALRHPSATNDDLIAIGFALARALDDFGHYAQSLDQLAQAHTLARSRYSWDAEAFDSAMAAFRAAFEPALAISDDVSLGREVIFIVGLPRSGSTLVEQILASHSSVEGAGELPDLPLVLDEESRRRGMPFPQWVSLMQSADWTRLGRRYLERTAHWRRQRPMFTDKLPNNWEYIGAIHAMLPSAHVVICRRDPLETCFSCYRQLLANNEYTRTFSDLATFWRGFDQSARHWRRLYPRRVFEHDYENMLADPEAGIRRLLDVCGLPFEMACLHFQETRRTVYSPSATQVRQPLRKDTAHTSRYGELLDPLRAALDLLPTST
jgi:Tfp pilus assembly protein PilF